MSEDNVGHLVEPGKPLWDEERWRPSHEAALVDEAEAFLRDIGLDARAAGVRRAARNAVRKSREES